MTPSEEKTHNKKRLKGTIVSHISDKTVIVLVERFKKHPKYKKYIKSNKRYKAHYEGNAYKTGDTVTIEETRPISKEKHFRILRSEQGERL